MRPRVAPPLNECLHKTPNEGELEIVGVHFCNTYRNCIGSKLSMISYKLGMISTKRCISSNSRLMISKKLGILSNKLINSSNKLSVIALPHSPALSCREKIVEGISSATL